jgi:hypothetical protein
VDHCWKQLERSLSCSSSELVISSRWGAPPILRGLEGTAGLEHQSLSSRYLLGFLRHLLPGSFSLAVMRTGVDNLIVCMYFVHMGTRNPVVNSEGRSSSEISLLSQLTCERLYNLTLREKPEGRLAEVCKSPESDRFRSARGGKELGKQVG